MIDVWALLLFFDIIAVVVYYKVSGSLIGSIIDGWILVLFFDIV